MTNDEMLTGMKADYKEGQFICRVEIIERSDEPNRMSDGTEYPWIGLKLRCLSANKYMNVGDEFNVGRAPEAAYAGWFLYPEGTFTNEQEPEGEPEVRCSTSRPKLSCLSRAQQGTHRDGQRKRTRG